ncbi:MAG: beta-galactosidase [Streptosporangiaceae bacterium]|nr:beta-galactosidase [Streptosporangiaceae bacterium]
MPSPPATGDGSASPLAEDQSTPPGSEDGTGDGDAGPHAAGADLAHAIAGAAAVTGTATAEAERLANEADTQPIPAAEYAQFFTAHGYASPGDGAGTDGSDGGGAAAEPGAAEDAAAESPGTAPEPPQPGRLAMSRRELLQAGLLGGGTAVAALPLFALVSGLLRSNKQQAGLVYPLTADWLFGGQFTPGSEATAHDDSGFARVTMPHTVRRLSWRNWDQASWQQVWIYRRHFDGGSLLGPHRPRSRIFVDFDGVMVNATVVINDKAVATHQGGYLPFSAELTGKVVAGDNVLAVIVDSRCLPVPPISAGRGPASIDFFQPGGIYRDVRLRVVPQAFLSDLFALPRAVLSPQPRVEVECSIDSALTGRTAATVLVELFDGDPPAGRVAAQTARVTLASPGIRTLALSLAVTGPVTLWSTDNPKLYTVQATLTVPGAGSHVLTRRIGFREASFRPDGFYLNGKRLQIFGLNRHQLFPYTGMAMPERVQRRDAEILRHELNCNMVRCSHYPQSPHFLDACDELGLLVWEEAPGWHDVTTGPAWQDLVVQNVRDMVIRDRSRPSVVIWGTRLNETPDLPGLWAATRQAAAELDGSRPSSGAMALHTRVGWDEDVFAFDDYGFNAKTGSMMLKPPFPGVPYMITETVGVAVARPEHFAWTDAPGHLERQAALHAQAQSLARSDPGYSGMLAWAGFDYASLQGLPPDNIKWAGVADSFRVPKPGAAIYQSQADPAVRPVIVPVFFWEPGGAFPSPSMIASNCDRLDLFIGGTQVATTLPARWSPLYRNLPYPPFFVDLPAHPRGATPDLLIRGYLANRQVAQLRMSAGPGGDFLGIAADDTAIVADGSDMTRVVFRALDAFGNQRRHASGEVVLALAGPAALVGDNPFAFGQYGGLGAVWVRSLAGQPGTITLTAAHPLLGRATVRLRSGPAGNQAQPL